MLRIKMADNAPLDICKTIQANYYNARKHNQRDIKSLRSTIIIKKGCLLNRTQLYHAWLLINDYQPEIAIVKNVRFSNGL